MVLDLSILVEWIPIILFMTGALGGFWKIASSLDKSINDLRYEIKTLTDFMAESRADRKDLHQKYEKMNDKYNDLAHRVGVLEDWRRGFTNGKLNK